MGIDKHAQLLYLRQLAPYILVCSVLIAAGMVFGFLSPVHAPNMAAKVSGPVGEFARKLSDLPRPYLALAIFFNNSIKTLLVIVLGTLCGIVPIVFLLFNGYVIGVFLYPAIQSKGWFASLLGIVPHGLFELPAVLLGTSIGLLLGIQMVKRIFGRLEATINGELRRAFSFFLTVIVPLLLLAAFIEAFISLGNG